MVFGLFLLGPLVSGIWYPFTETPSPMPLIPCIPPPRGLIYGHAKHGGIADAGRQKGFFVAFDYTEDALE
jgi:hypothetical protein